MCIVTTSSLGPDRGSPEPQRVRGKVTQQVRVTRRCSRGCCGSGEPRSGSFGVWNALEQSVRQCYKIMVNFPAATTGSPASTEAAAAVQHIRELSPQQWRSGIAAWLGWLFDGLDMHLYTLVYAQFVAELLHVSSTADPSVGRHASIIQGGFPLGWAVGGGLFGRIGDRLGRLRSPC